jgi:hypothetical protein
MSEMSKEAEDLLSRARAVPPLSRERQIKVRAALLGQIALAPATGAAAGALGKLGLVKLLMVVGAVGAVGTGALTLARKSDAPREPAPVALHAAPRAPEHSPAPPIAETAREVPKVDAPTLAREPVGRRATNTEPRVARKTASVAPAPADPDSLREEIELVQKANSALRGGKPEQAQALLDQHGEKFGSGALREEREAARILALCALGKQAEAQAAAAKFLRESPRSMQAARVRGSCASKGNPKAR